MGSLSGVVDIVDVAVDGQWTSAGVLATVTLLDLESRPLVGALNECCLIVLLAPHDVFVLIVVVVVVVVVVVAAAAVQHARRNARANPTSSELTLCGSL